MSPAGSQPQSYHVACFCLGGTPHFDVTVQIEQGHVVDVVPGKSHSAVELGRVALVDGLVNAHTHLEFSLLSQPIPTNGRFTDWIRSVVKHRQAHPDSTADAIRAGIRESLSAGTTLIGEIATTGWSASDYAAAGCPTVVFQEVLGQSPVRVSQQVQLARSVVETAAGKLSPGISPHAPYSTHLDLVRESVAIARMRGCPVAMHLAETSSELELLTSQSGEFRELLSDFGIWNENLFPTPRRALDYLHVLAEAPRALIVHGNYLNDEELRFIAAQPQMTLVYCPRTHFAFGHDPHPWRRLLKMGGRVAIGTDSRASNPDLSLFAELQFLARHHPEISPWELLQAGSITGRTALDPESNASPTAANLTSIALGEIQDANFGQTLFHLKSHVCGTMIQGKWVWRNTDGSSIAR
ncbi:amidohydrolase family protein [Schlesneria sp. T3-172]|uniref:amidohydrolase family protein n=1 Tax=Schlesneria sphaerica TaxID=3373610 RepID=UPI0037CAEB8E